MIPCQFGSLKGYLNKLNSKNNIKTKTLKTIT